MTFSNFSEFWFFRFQLIFKVFSLDCWTVSTSNPCLVTSNDAFDECRVLSYAVKHRFSISTFVELIGKRCWDSLLYLWCHDDFQAFFSILSSLRCMDDSREASFRWPELNYLCHVNACIRADAFCNIFNDSADLIPFYTQNFKQTRLIFHGKKANCTHTKWQS